MPTVTTITFDSLLDRSTRKSSSSSSQSNRLFDPKKPGNLARDDPGTNGWNSSNGATTRSSGVVELRKRFPPVYRISPALYATPEPAQLSASSPASVSPDPYVVNHKRRDSRPPAAIPAAAYSDESKCIGGFEVGGKDNPVSGVLAAGDVTANGADDNRVASTSVAEPVVEELGGWRNGIIEEEEEKVKSDAKEIALNGASNEIGFANGGGGGSLEKEEPGDDDFDDFFNPRDSMSVMSSSDTEEGGSSRCRGLLKNTPLSNNVEFYDATEDFLSDSSASQASSFHANLEADLRSLRLSLFEEIERCKKAEESLIHMQNQWKRIGTYFSQMGLTFPPIPDGQKTQHEEDSVAQLCQEVVVARFVSEAVERGLTRAEVEASAEAVIESKNQEIARLYDRLQYYEAMNCEMSQRNQEAIELTRRQRQRRRTRQRWIWGCIGMSVTIGASLLAYSFIPQGGKDSQLPSEESADSSSAL